MGAPANSLSRMGRLLDVGCTCAGSRRRGYASRMVCTVRVLAVVALREEVSQIDPMIMGVRRGTGVVDWPPSGGVRADSRHIEFSAKTYEM